jgi:rubrerythrin
MLQSGVGETIEHLLAYSIEIEYNVAHIYAALSKLFPHVEGLADFWRGLAEDEIRHAAILQEIRKLLTPEQLLSSSDQKMRDDVARIHSRLRKDLTGEINTLDDAYELAHDLEFSEVNAVFQFLAGEYIPSGERKQLVRSEIEQHLNKLLNFPRTFGERDWRKEIHIQRI